MRDVFVEIWESLRRNKLRTCLTGFAVAWGIFMLIVLLGAGNGIMNMANSNMEGINVNTMKDEAVMREGGTLEFCRMNEMVVQTWSPLQKGFFGGVFIGDPEYAQLNEVLKELAEKHGCTEDAIAYAWLLRYPAKIQVITGTTKPQRIVNAAQAAEITLTREDWYRIYKASGKTLP